MKQELASPTQYHKFITKSLDTEITIVAFHWNSKIHTVLNKNTNTYTHKKKALLNNMELLGKRFNMEMIWKAHLLLYIQV